MNTARKITPWSFAQALDAAGIVDDLNNVAEVRIICKFDRPVMIEIDKFADERLYDLVNPAPSKET